MSSKSQILIVGSGGVGTMTGYALETGGLASVTAVCRSNYTAASTQGFTIDSIDHGRDIKNWKPTRIVNSVPSDQRFDYVLATTKNVPDVPPTLVDIIRPAITPGHTTIILLQNGLNIEKPILAAFPENIVLSAISLIQARETAPACILHDDHDSAKLGVFPGQQNLIGADKSAQAFLNIYSACGKTRWLLDPSVPHSRWRKLLYNTSFNSISAILAMDTTRMRMSRFIIDSLIRPAMLEIVAVAGANGVVLEETTVEQMIVTDDIETYFVPSMGQDAKKGNFMEVENIVGEPVREADKAGVPAPTLKTIYGLLQGMQLKTKEAKGLWTPKFDPGNPYA